MPRRFQGQPQALYPQVPPPPGLEPHPDSNIVGWQGAQDPAWVQGNQQPAPVSLPAPSASAPLDVPPTAAATLVLALRRAFRLHIDSREVTDAERAALESTSPPITDHDVQGFLVWRRSVQLVVAIAMVPLLLFQIASLAASERNPGALNALLVLQLVIDLGFTILLCSQLREWMHWQKQRRVLAAAWLAFFLVPFVLYLYPLRAAVDDLLARQTSGPELAELGTMLAGMMASLAAMIELAPRTIALLPGVLRGAITSKLLFPGASGPGWLVLLLAPVYALLLYVVLIVPYQLTGNGLFVPAMLGLIGGQVWLGRMGHQLARPESLEEALVLVRKVRATYLALNLLGLVFALFGLLDLLDKLDLPIWRGFQVLLAVLVNVLILTLVATDQIVANLVHEQRLLGMTGTSQAQAEFARGIAHFDEQPHT